MKKVVLIVDDNVTLRNQVQQFLGRLNCEVIAASDGAECVAVVQRRRPHLILLDVDMPKVGGFAALELLAERELLHGIKVIMMTGQNERDLVLKALSLGAVDYIVKPFELKALKERLDKHLGGIIQKEIPADIKKLTG